MTWSDAARRAAAEARRRSRGAPIQEHMYGYGSIGRTIHTPAARKRIADELRAWRRLRTIQQDDVGAMSAQFATGSSSTALRNYARSGGSIVPPVTSWGPGDRERYKALIDAAVKNDASRLRSKIRTSYGYDIRGTNARSGGSEPGSGPARVDPKYARPGGTTRRGTILGDVTMSEHSSMMKQFLKASRKRRR